ncbi:PQQ-dependent sugar dehydrogenase [Chondrinema litorale]|uniref:PQQ-dependent sugar dehydrogenase n=1 Tax=Chondrinema litorale TaxID=2994555 RepID=UPI0025429BD0|nr:PQQ-dependent sugar dehydrogenase [Chondrinema litorale]UZR92704.1 PQQ-dependent sugar dehydrogenase [Chondrinema litorale]
MNFKSIASIIVLCILLVSCGEKNVVDLPAESYIVETIATPPGLRAETGGIAFLPDGRLIACFHLGEVMTYDPKSKRWTVFAKGLHDPLGIYPISNNEVWVMQRPELTKLVDTDNDGEADLYETITDDFGMSGNYHEFAFGPEPDGKGDFYITLNTASNGAGVRNEKRGEYNPNGRPGRMYSAVPYRGWIMHLDIETGKLEPFASGVRSPNGLEVDDEGNLFVTDNQGDWLGTSKLFHIKKGKFYGHPAGLVWEKGFEDVDPLQLPPAVLNKMRQPAAVLFPHGIMANSPTQPLVDRTEGKFGPFAGQLLVGEMDHEYVMRVMLEEVDGELQGACVALVDSIGLRKGNNRLAFAPDGSLWIGQNDHGWLGDEGIQRLIYTGKVPTDVLNMSLTDKGFQLTFTKEMSQQAAENPENFKFKRYYYKYHRRYGSPQTDVQDVKIQAINYNPESKTTTVELDTLKPGYVYDLEINNMAAADGDSLVNNHLYYTLNRLRN